MDRAPADARAPRAFPRRPPPSRLPLRKLLVGRSPQVHRAGRSRAALGSPRAAQAGQRLPAATIAGRAPGPGPAPRPARAPCSACALFRRRLRLLRKGRRSGLLAAASRSLPSALPPERSSVIYITPPPAFLRVRWLRAPARARTHDHTRARARTIHTAAHEHTRTHTHICTPAHAHARICTHAAGARAPRTSRLAGSLRGASPCGRPPATRALGGDAVWADPHQALSPRPPRGAPRGTLALPARHAGAPRRGPGRG